MVIEKCEDLDVYTRSFNGAMEIFNATKSFPKEEKFSLVDQIRRSTRSVTANISEGFAKRKYPDVFIRHLNDALGSSEETLTWLKFSKECGYLENSVFVKLEQEYKELSAMLYSLMKSWQKF